MREIIFRGYNPQTKKWYYGFLNKYNGLYFINDGTGTTPYVEEDSIGQYTGLEDKRGNKIFEGDILDRGFGITSIVEFEAGVWISKNDKYKSLTFTLYQDAHSSYCEIVGNIYEEKLKRG